MNTATRTLLSVATGVLLLAGIAATANTAPVPTSTTTLAAPAHGQPRVPEIPPPADLVAAVEDAQAAVTREEQERERREAAEPFTGYTCEPSAPNKFDDPANPNHITNKACDDITAAKERANREYATSGEYVAPDEYATDDESVGDNGIDVDTYCDPYTGMMLDGTEC